MNKAFTYTGILAAAILLMGATITGYSDWVKRSTPGNPAAANLRMYADSTAAKFKCIDSTGAACYYDTAAPSVVLISEQSPTGVGTLTFSSIAATYRDLRIVVRGQTSAAATVAEVRIQFNADTGSNYVQESTTTNGATNSSAGVTSQTYLFTGWLQGSTGPTNASAASRIDILDYRGTTFQKTVIASGGTRAVAVPATTDLFNLTMNGWWNNTAAITSVTVFLSSGNYVTGSTVSLYGLL